jgi:predicted amino acid racemase
MSAFEEIIGHLVHVHICETSSVSSAVLSATKDREKLAAGDVIKLRLTKQPLPRLWHTFSTPSDEDELIQRALYPELQ